MGTTSVRVDAQLLRDIFSDPDAIGRAYAQDPERFRALIQSDARAKDVIALQRRMEVVETMRAWLEDDSVFDDAKEGAGGPEHAWQRLLEENQWILGLSLSGQIFSSWDSDKLEQVVVGADIGTVGKRVDALMRTNGLIRTMAFAEIKHHRTELLGKEYRSGSWAPSKELAGAVVQLQQTVRTAVRDLGEYVEDRADDGSRNGTGTFIVHPRSFLVVGSLSQLQGSAGGPIDDKVHSFEGFRRSLQEPEIITFDELLARAEWHVRFAEEEAADEGHDLQGGGEGFD